MKFYKLPTGELVSTQANVREAGFKLAQAPIEDVPTTDKEKMREYLNARRVAPASPVVDGPPEARLTPEPVRGKDMDALSVISDVDGAAQGIDVDKIVRTIMQSKSFVLARFAKAVAYAYEGLTK